MAYYYGLKEYNRLELHYWLEGEMHSMDAFVQNKCERELLELLSEIAATFSAEIIVETEPLAEGGIRRFFKVIAKEEGKKAVITTAIVTAIATSIIVTPITTSISKLTEIAIEKVFQDREAINLQNENKRLENEKLKQDIKIDSLLLEHNTRIEKSRMNFYMQLEKENRMEKISFVLGNGIHNNLTDEIFIDRNKFKEFQSFEPMLEVMQANQNQSADTAITERYVEVVEASIEITAPVFTGGSGKWKGIYNGKSISFKMESPQFNDDVQSGRVQFKKGTTIHCLLEIKRGSGKVKEYAVKEVKDIGNVSGQ